MTTEIENGEEAGKPQVSGRVKIEWNWDLDDEGQQIKSIGLGAQKYVLGDEGRFGLKGRCRRCWGGLIGKTDAGHEATAIRCRVCDIILEGIVKLIECRLFSAFLHEAKCPSGDFMSRMNRLSGGPS